MRVRHQGLHPWATWISFATDEIVFDDSDGEQFRLLRPYHGEVVSGATYEIDGTPESGAGVTFRIEYSDDFGATWNALASGVSSLPWEWDTTVYDDGEEYAIRVRAETAGAQTVWDVRQVVIDNNGVLTITGFNAATRDPDEDLSVDWTEGWNTVGHDWAGYGGGISDTGSRLLDSGLSILAFDQG